MMRRLVGEIAARECVLDECDQGDPAAAYERRAYLKDIPVLDMNENVEQLGKPVVI